MRHNLPGYRLTEIVGPGGPVDDEVSGLDGPVIDEAAVGGPVAIGGSATVVRGVRLADDQLVAVKVYAPGDRARAEREAEIGHAIDHPHVLRVVDVIATDECEALIFPWMEGGSLAQLLENRHRIRWTEALTVLIPLADALAAAHERGFVHGDVTCANVLFDARGRPMLSDFGASRAAMECGVEVAVTPTDVAPEVARGGVPDAAADLFSLGSVALRCLTGRPAWPADDLRDVVVQSAAGQWPDIEDHMAPQEWCALVRRLLAAEPAERGSAGSLAVDLRVIGDPEPIELGRRDADGRVRAPAPATQVRADAVRPPVAALPPHPVPSTFSPVRWVRRSWRSAVPVAAVALLLALAIGGGWWWAGRGADAPTLASAPATSPDVSSPAASTLPSGSAVSPAPSPPAPLATSGIGTPLAPPTGDASGSTADAPGDSRAAPSFSARSAVDAIAPDWRSVVSSLDQARSKALVTRDASLLSAVYEPGAAARSVDAHRIAEMGSAGHRVISAAHQVRSVTLVRRDADGDATVEVVEALPSYAVHDASGATIGHTRAVPSRTVRMRLSPTHDGFRIDRILTDTAG